MVDVVIVIDALYDFMDYNGSFALHYGIESCQPLFDLKFTLNEIVRIAEFKRKLIIFVTSHYENNQFCDMKSSALSTLCTTEKGSEIVLNSRITSTDIMVIIKTTNYILDCTEEKMKNDLLNAIQNKRVLICGVTLSHCVMKSSLQLIHRCRKLIIAKTGVASRVTSSSTHTNNNEIYLSLKRNGVEIIDDWKALFTNETKTECVDNQSADEWLYWLIKQFQLVNDSTVF